MVTLQPMTPADFARRCAALRESYAESLRTARAIPLDAARVEAARQMALVLPLGLGSPKMLLRTATVDGTDVGWLWVGLPGAPGSPGMAWIHHIGVDPAQRGKGYGRAIITLLESELADRGVARLGLNVFGDNAVARRLYESLGFRVTAQQMAKVLRADGADRVLRADSAD